MLPKKNRVDKKTVKKIFRIGRFINSPNFSFKFILTNKSFVARISFIVSKSFVKKAVSRNLLKRHGYIALEKYINKFPVGLVGVFLFKKYQDDNTIIENEIKNILNQIN